MLTSQDLSIVIQGPILSSSGQKGDRDVTIRCLASIRTFFPESQIILSTWNGENTDGLDYDLLIKSKDPGAVPFNDRGDPPAFNNINRQIVSTQAGLAAVTRPYAVKFRGDLLFESADLLHHSEVLTAPLPHGLFQSRVLISSYFTRNPRRSLMTFHYSDIVQAGKTEDLRKYWSVPLAPEPETTRWLEHRKFVLFRPVINIYMRLVCEQYLGIHLLATTGRRVFLDYPWDISCSKLLLSEKMLIDNFYLLEPHQMGVRLSDRLAHTRTDDIYRNADWDRLSRAYGRPISRWMVQADLLAQAYWMVMDRFFQKCFNGSPLQKFPPYIWLRDCYRRFIPLP